jgi:PTS system cellobiose-specific IIC component
MEKTKKGSFVEKTILPFAEKLTRQRHLAAIQKAFMSNLNFIMIGSFALILADPPVDYTTLTPGTALYGFFSGWAAFSGVAGGVLYGIFNATLGCLSLFVCIGTAHFLAQHYKLGTMIPVVTAVSTFFILNTRWEDGGWVARFFEGPGLFAAIVVGILSVELYRFLLKRKVGYIKLPDAVPEALSSTFESLVPSAIIATAAALLNLALNLIFKVTLPEMVILIFSPLAAAVDNVVGTGFATLLQQILWWFGIHDTALGTVLEPFRVSNLASNAAAYATGTAPANLPYVLTTPFWFVFCTIGGSGATLGLALLLLTARSKQLKTVGRLGIVPGIFNINEPLLFGMPIVFNPLFFVPFAGAQLFNCIVTYLSMASGIVNKTFIEPGWNLFAPIGALIATLDIRAVILCLILIAADTLIYLPFFKVYDNALYKKEQEEISTAG